MKNYGKLTLLTLTLALSWCGSVQALCINEVMAANAAFVPDPQGQYDDWIELHNPGTTPVDCGGTYLTDSIANPTKWRIPWGNRQLTTIPAGGYLLIWADGDVGDAGLHASFSLNATRDDVALYDRDGVTLLDYVSFDDQTADISYGRLPDGAEVWQRFAVPTPGTKNIAVYDGFVAAPVFSPERGFCAGEVVVTLSTETEGATIYYTTDGSEPYELGGRFPSGRVYQEPLRISSTTCLRAKAIKARWMPSATQTHTYLFLQDVIRQSASGGPPGAGWPAGNVSSQTIDYGMDPDVVNDARYKDLMDDALLSIPSISLVTKLDNLFDAQSGIYTHASSQGRTWERPVSVELLNPDGSEGFQIDAGLRIRGGFSRSGSNPKHALRLFFRPEYGQAKLKFPLFEDEGTDEFENVDLRTSQNYSWSFQGDRQNTMVREVFSRDLQGEMGHPYTRSRYYHLYLNGQHWGLYQTQERAEASYAASYLGGDKDDYDVIKSESGSYSITTTDGNLDAYQRLYDAAMAGLGDNQRYYQIQGLNLDGTPNPDYERLLDVDNLIDFMIIDYYTGDRDGPGSRFVNRPNNTYGIYNRADPDGWKWFQHDNEHTLGVSQSETNLVTPFTSAGAQWRYFNPHWLHERLAATNIDYRMRFADHAYRHFFNGGLLTPEASSARIQRRAAQIEMAIIAESARWGDARRHPPYTKQDWQNEVNRIVNTYLPGRTEVVLGQFKTVGWYPNIDPPSFNQAGGHVQRNFSLWMSGWSGTIYYTLDGSDPRLSGGALNSSQAQMYTESIRLAQSTNVKARMRSGSTWSALNEAVFAVGPVAESLRISEIMYHPLDTGSPSDPNTEYLELTNTGSQTINLNLVRFSDGVRYTFPSFDLPVGGYCLIVRDVAAFQARYGAHLPVVGQYAGSLNNAGERIELVDALGQMIQSFEYNDNWFDITDGLGFSLTVRDPQVAAASNLDGKGLWRPSAHVNGSPGTDDSGQVPELGSVVINELLANSAGGEPDWIELHNTTAQAISIGGWFLSDDANDLTKYQIAAGTSIPAGGYLVFSEDKHFGSQSDPGSKKTFGLSKNGETVYLHSGSQGALTGYSEQEKFDASEAGVSLGRWQKSTGSYNFVALKEPTPGQANAAPVVGPVVINEIMYHPADVPDAEYVELLNISNAPVTLYDATGRAPWRFTDDPEDPGIELLFPADAPMTLAPGEYIILAKDENLVRATYSLPANVKVLAWGAGNLANGSEKIQLSRPGDEDADGNRCWIRVDRVVYSDGSQHGDFPDGRDPWPLSPDGHGLSLNRISSTGYGNDHANWRAGLPSPGSTNP